MNAMCTTCNIHCKGSQCTFTNILFIIPCCILKLPFLNEIVDILSPNILSCEKYLNINLHYALLQSMRGLHSVYVEGKT